MPESATPSVRVLFLTRYPQLGASSRYRVYQYISYLEDIGVSTSVQSFMDDQMYLISIRPGNTLTKVKLTLLAIGRRLAALSKWRRYDIIYMQRELFPMGPPLVERWLKWRGAVLFFDYDDALFIGKSSRFNPIATFFRSPSKTFELFRIVHRVIAGNNWLRDVAIQHGAAADTVEVAEDVARYRQKPAPAESDAVTIGWLGSPSTVKYLRLIEQPLRQIAARYPTVRFEIMGGGDFDMRGVPWVHTDWSLEGEVDALSRFDIGLMPLPDEDWAKGKSGGKARAYMAAGVVPVCTGIGYNIELISTGVTGFLCTDAESWLQTLVALIESAELRREVSVRARKDVAERFSPMLKAEELKNHFISTLESRHRAH